MGRKAMKERKPIEYVRALLESPGLTLADIYERTGWGQTTLSHFTIAWGIKRKQVHKKRPQ